MNLLNMIALAVALAMDACVVAAGAGAGGRSTGARAGFRLSFHFGLFQFFMPILGWFAGNTIAGFMAAVDHWIAFALLAAIGGHMIKAGLSPRTNDTHPDPSRGWTLILLAIATSIDALAVGFSLAMVQVDIWYPAVIIGVITAGMSVLGLYLGRRLGDRFGQRLEVFGGVILILVGTRILLSHLALI